ncbi:uncharacterized protein EAF01_005595 [Botrytis porri]|uniref:Ent-kaurene synthase n=1 Tax=Botrytis porri TaxID=87229 RepID=A0A4Z1K7I9_9HELO|nr:uncharacterized protein EAF01_005595 [Botrytis porri]KAF7905074.1 hypothetical protein EAF01_005595 [Botrytis porri]TGO81628.1 hypothetical protein BPOR_1076g00010 [Botrytis porri]
MSVSSSYQKQARALLAKLAAQCSSISGKGFGSMSSSLYDTAWLSMVKIPKTKSGNNSASVWLFPECFEFVLAQQLPSGAWESYATPVDGILNTAAALLSLVRHLQVQPDSHDWQLRSQKAQVALKKLLNEWDMDSTDQVGQEILIISLLGLLEGEGVSIKFPQLSALRAVRDAKLAKIPPSTIYKMKSTLYHSLEAFIGHIDFDNVSQWRERNGSMMNSPAATAAYLMNVSVWDPRSESYLRDVVSRDNGIHGGGVPCAWPTTIFEISWVIPTLAAVGVSANPSDTSVLINLLQNTLEQQKGLLGFAPGILPDVDDTSKGLETLCYLGHSSSAEGVIQAFEGKEHFLTYRGERNPSFSANCNVLIFFLDRDDRAQYVPQISKTVQFLASQAFNENVKEKWHRNNLYWMMLMARAFDLLYRNGEVAQMVFEENPSLKEQIPMILLQILMRILNTQQKNGSWAGVCEITSYSILALSSLLKLPFVRQLDKGKIISSVALGKSFLHSHRDEWTKGQYMWIEKVTYSSGILSEAYCLAASLVEVPFLVEPETVSMIGASLEGKGFLVPEKVLMDMHKTGDLMALTALFRDTKPSTFQIAEMQACFALQSLQRHPTNIFPRTAKGKDKYVFIIPLALILCAAARGCCTSLSVLYEMMVLSILNFHADEYMEGIIERYFETDLDSVRQVVRQLFTDPHITPQSNVANCKTKDLNNGHDEADFSVKNVGSSSNSHIDGIFDPGQKTGLGDRPSLENVKSVLSQFKRQIMEHPAVLSSPGRLQARLASNLQTFLLAHIMQAEDNYRLRAQSRPHENGSIHNGGDYAHEVNKNQPLQYRNPNRSFYSWVRGTSADHTSCPFSFIFFECLVLHALSSTKQTRTIGTLVSARTTYLSEDACRHLSSLCRMYNDYGSLSRDAEERSLNSVGFPEFWDCAEKTEFASNDVKSELLWIAEYERRGLDMAMTLLEKELGHGDLMDALRLFVDVTDLYGQIYVLKDVGTRTQ